VFTPTGCDRRGVGEGSISFVPAWRIGSAPFTRGFDRSGVRSTLAEVKSPKRSQSIEIHPNPPLENFSICHTSSHTDFDALSNVCVSA